MHIATTVGLAVICLASASCRPPDRAAGSAATARNQSAPSPAQPHADPSPTPARPQDAAPAAQPASPGVFEVEIWPGEGRPRLVARRTTLTPRAEPRKDAPAAAAIQVENGRPLEFAATVYRTSEPGRLKAVKDAHVAGRRLGPIRRLSRDEYYSDRYPAVSVALRPGEIIEYLQDRAEGSCFVRVRGDVIEADPCPHPAADHFALESEPRTEWWVQVTIDGQPRGWLLVDGKDVREEGRTFLPGGAS